MAPPDAEAGGTNPMKRLQHFFTYNWRAKLASLALATVVWLVVKHGIAYAPAQQPPPPLPPPAIGPPG